MQLPTELWYIHQEPDDRWLARRGIERILFDTEQEAREYIKMTERIKPEVEYDNKIRANMIDPARAIIIGMTDTDLLSEINGIPQMVAATAPGEKVGDSSLTKERAEDIAEVAAAFKVFLGTAMASGKKPIQVLMMRD